MSQALVAIGSNLGDREAQLRQAVVLLTSPGDDVRLVRVGAMRETSPVGGSADQPAYLNGAVLVETSLSPRDLLSRLMEVERSLGRQRTEHWGPRTVDLDLLLYDNVVLQSPTLTLPHPRMAFRRFVLEPAAEIAGEMRHPIIGWTVAELLDHLNKARPYVAIGGADVSNTHRLAAAVADRAGWRLLEFPGAGDEKLPVGSPSLTFKRAVEFLRERADLLAGVDWDAFDAAGGEGNRTCGGVVTSFWIEDLIAIGDVLWPGQLDDELQAIQRRIVRPKLLAVYDGLPPRSFDVSTDAGALWQMLNEARRSRARRGCIGPVLWLDDADPAAAERELVAAIQAMM